MPVPTLVTDLSTTLASNSPAGSDNVFPDLDNYLRALSGFVASIRDNSGNGWITPYLAIAGGTATGNLNVPSLNTGQLAGMRNKILNGKMEIAQRGTSFAAVAFGAYTLDRFAYLGVATSAAVTISQQSDVPSSNEFQNSLRVAVTTADTSIAAGDAAYVTQPVEGFNVRDLIGRTFTLSFWVRSSKTGTHCVSFRNAVPDRSFIAEYTVSAANTWEYKSVTVPGGLITAGTWNWTNGAGLYVGWALAAGTTFQTTAGAWQTGTFLATSNQVNCLDSNTNIFAITGVQLEVGGVSTPFEHRPYGAELALCQRYYYRQPASTSRSGVGQSPSTTQARLNIPFPVVMRAKPTSVEQSGTAADYTVINGTGTVVNSSSVPTFDSADELAGQVIYTTAGSLTAGQAVFGRNVSSAYLGWSAEL